MALLQERLIVLEEQVVSAPGQPWRSACLVALEARRQRYQAKNVQKTLDLVTTQQRDVVILDVSPPDRDGLEVLTCLQQTHPCQS
jgi:CheY-like chemotaxis protein